MKEQAMTFIRGTVIISVEQIDGFGKKPGLWLGKKSETENWQGKVASFGSEQSAKDFCDWLKYMVGLTDQEPMKGIKEL